MIETNNLQTTNPAIDTFENQQQNDHVMTTTAAGGFD